MAKEPSCIVSAIPANKHKINDFLSPSDLQSDRDLNDESKNQADITEDRLFTLEDFTYNNSGVANRIFNHLSQIEFTGITVIAFLHIAQDIKRLWKLIVFYMDIAHYCYTLRVLYHSVKMV